MNKKRAATNKDDQAKDKEQEKIKYMQTISNGKVKSETKKWKIGVWNTRSLNGKEDEIIYEIMKANLDILVIPETKKKGIGEMELINGYMLMYSGVRDNKRATDGIGCILNENLNKQIIKWKGWNERILTIDLMLGKDKITLIAVYGPNENESKEIKEKFWEELALVTEESTGITIVAGDFNARVGVRKDEWEYVVGKHGERTRNSNGDKMLMYCILNDLIIANTFYEHKAIHKYTRVQQSRNEKSIIDYILIEKNSRKLIKDVRVRRGPEIYSDHLLLVGSFKTTNKCEIREKKEQNRNSTQISIKSYKLQEAETAEKYESMVNNELQRCKYDTEKMDGEEMWNILKNILIKAAAQVCGINKINKRCKKTAWWNDEIKKEIKIKKKKWEDYLAKKTDTEYNKYKIQRKKVNQLVKRAKTKSWQEFGEKIENSNKVNQKLFYKILKSLRKDKTVQTLNIKNKDGEILTEDKSIMKRWREHFQELLGTEDEDVKRSQQTKEENTREEGKIKTASQNPSYVTEEELDKALKRTKNGKAPGADKISAEMLKKMGNRGKLFLLELYNKLWSEEIIPHDWEIGQIVPIHKKGDKKQCQNYRGISLLSLPLKLYELILEEKLRKTIEPTLMEAQSGFRKGRSVQDHIFTIKQVTEKLLEHNRKAFIAFVDLEKAFDSVPRQKVWLCLKNRNVDQKLINIAQSLYKCTKNQVIYNNNVSEEFITREGLRQGGVMSPLLFSIYMDDIMKKCHKLTKHLFVGYKHLAPVYLAECAFADDIIIAAGNEQDLQKNLTIWNNELKAQGMTMNTQKTKVMAISRVPQLLNIEIEGKLIEQVQNYVYLGVVINETGNHEIDLNERINKSNNLFYALNKTFIRKKEIKQETKIKIYKTIYRPVLTYGCETWVLSGKTRRRIEAVEMKFLRGARGVTLRDHVRSTQIREDLGVEPITEFIERRQLSWWGHLQRMKVDRTVRQVWEAKVVGKRSKGRPQQTWDKAIGKILKERGKTWATAKTLAINKKLWSEFVHGQ